MTNLLYIIIYTFCYLLSLLPMWLLYGISDVLYPSVYYIIRYRRKMVRKNLLIAFPEKDGKETTEITKKFYRFFCDYLVETIKLFSISDKEMRKRMQFEGVDEITGSLRREGKQFAFLYLAHYGNWEWVSSLTARLKESNPEVAGGQVYHPLHNKAMDRIFLKIRHRFQGDNIPMKTTLRHILLQRREGIRSIIGFISDQRPKRSSIHHATDFMGKKTPVLIGAEHIGKQVDALVFYGKMERVKRGYYICRFTRMVEDIRQYEDYEVTDLYMRKLEEQIRECPYYWLWTHDRWRHAI